MSGRLCFNPLGRGMGLGGKNDHRRPMISLSFNPLGRGMGLGGRYKTVDHCRTKVSIRLDAAWVLGEIPSC